VVLFLACEDSSFMTGEEVVRRRWNDPHLIRPLWGLVLQSQVQRAMTPRRRKRTSLLGQKRTFSFCCYTGRTDKSSSVTFLPARRSDFSPFQSAAGPAAPRAGKGATVPVCVSGPANSRQRFRAGDASWTPARNRLSNGTARASAAPKAGPLRIALLRGVDLRVGRVVRAGLPVA